MTQDTTPISATRFAAIDFESAGAERGATDVPVQVGVALMEGGEILTEHHFVSYLGTDRPIRWSAQRVHGISTADLVGAPELRQLWPRLKGLLDGRAVVAHGAGTERRFLRAFPLHGFGPWVDTLQVARCLLPGQPKYSLGALVDALGKTAETDTLCPDKSWHDALYDATASLVLLQEIVRVTGVENAPLEVLIRPQRDGKKRQHPRR